MGKFLLTKEKIHILFNEELSKRKVKLNYVLCKNVK